MRKALILLVCSTIVAIAWESPAWPKPGDLKWKFPVGGYNLSLLIDNTGNRIVATSEHTSTKSHLVSIDSDGNMNWQKLSCCVYYAITIDSHDNIIMAEKHSENGKTFWKTTSYSPSGEINWETSYEVENSTSIRAAAVDSNDNIVVAGEEHPINGSYDWKVVSYSSSGEMNWEVSYNSGGCDTIRAVAIDSNDNVIVAGMTTIGGTTCLWTIISYSPSGSVNWNVSYNGSCSNILADMAIDSHNNIITVGTTALNTSYAWTVISYSPAGGVNWEVTRNSELEGWADAVAVDSNDNVIVVGSDNQSNWRVISYKPAGSINWRATYEMEVSGYPTEVAIDKSDNAIVVGSESNGSDYDWSIVSFSPSGQINWHASYDGRNSEYSVSSSPEDPGRRMKTFSPYDDYALAVSIDKRTGDIVVGGDILDRSSSLIIDCEGNNSSSLRGHILVPSETRTVQPAASSPDPDNGKYLGFGDCVSGGTSFKVDAAFPRYLNQNDNSTLSVKIFVLGVIPSLPTYLLFFDTAGNLKVLPGDSLSPWKKGITDQVEPTTIIPALSLTDQGIHDALAGTNYWYTLVVPDTVADDLSDMDWDNTPWELTVNIFDVAD